MVLGLFWSVNAYADKRNWICKKIDKNLSECQSDRVSSTFKVKEIFVGKTNNNLPSGNGKISFEINGEKIDDYGEGIFILDNNNNLILFTGKQFVDKNTFYKENNKHYKTLYNNGDVFEGSYYDSGVIPMKGKFTFNNGDEYKGTITKDEKYLNGIYYFKDGTKIKYKNSNQIKTIEKTQYILFLVPFVFFIIYKLIKSNKINNSLGKILNSSKLYLKEKGFKSRVDYNFLIILIVVLGPGTLILISWISDFLGIYGIAKFVNSIFNIDFFIVYIYLILSTLASLLWWGFIILEKLFQKNK